MTVIHDNALNLIGKYVSFYTEHLYPHMGVVDSVSVYLDGRIQISFDDIEFYDLSNTSKFNILGEVAILEKPLPLINEIN